MKFTNALFFAFFSSLCSISALRPSPNNSRNLSDPTCSNNEIDVLVIGAGMAGSAAIHELQKQYAGDFGNKVAWLEARDYIGGRMRSQSVGNTRVEVGATWVAGSEGNPVFELAWNYALSLTQQTWGNIVYYQNGKVVQPGNIPSFQSASDCIYEGSFENVDNPGYIPPSVSVRDYLLTACNWDASNSPIARAVEWFNIDYEFATSGEYTSMYEFPLYVYGYDFQGKSFHTHDQNTVNRISSPFQGGYNRIPATYVDQAVPSFDTAVTEIKWDNADGTASVTAVNNINGNCVIYKASKVILTVSVGVLASGDISFDPPIPNKLESMSNVLDMKLFYKFVFRFSDKFWGNSEVYNFAIEDPNACNMWQSLDTRGYKFLRNSNILFCVLVTEQIESGEYDLDDEPALIKKLLAPWKAVLGRDPPTPTHFTFHRWGDDPYAYGSYEVWKPSEDATLANYDAFVAPLKNPNTNLNVIHFAGSATCFRHRAYVHGALYSGEKAARKVMNELDSSLQLSEINACDVPPSGGYGNPKYPVAK